MGGRRMGGGGADLGERDLARGVRDFHEALLAELDLLVVAA